MNPELPYILREAEESAIWRYREQVEARLAELAELARLGHAWVNDRHIDHVIYNMRMTRPASRNPEKSSASIESNMTILV